MVVPVYICTGFLDSGKTTFIKETLMRQDWIEDGPTLYIACEEGEEELPEEYLKENKMIPLQVEEMEQLTPAFFENCQKSYNPVQIIIELNGMWSLQDFLEGEFPRDWEIQGIYSTVNGETLPMYLKNMRNLLINQLVESELIIINRCGEEIDRAAFRRILKIQNPMAQLIFEDMEGKIIPQTEEDLPYDVKADVIEIDDMDFGIWYVDSYEHPERYENKLICYLAQTFRPKKMKQTMMVPGRQIMACCAEDVQFFGYPCKLCPGVTIEQRGWAKVTVRFKMEAPGPFAPPQPMLYLSKLEKAEKPEEEVVYMG